MSGGDSTRSNSSSKGEEGERNMRWGDMLQVDRSGPDATCDEVLASEISSRMLLSEGELFALRS